MQTFLPYADFVVSARVLDWRRLGKQRGEAKQILVSAGWRSHPAVIQWKGYEHALCVYAIAVCTEWRRRGYKDVQLEFFQSLRYPDTGMPPWLGREDYHASHRSNLLRKDFNHYSRFGWSESADLPYVWPSKE